MMTKEQEREYARAWRKKHPYSTLSQEQKARRNIRKRENDRIRRARMTAQELEQCRAKRREWNRIYKRSQKLKSPLTEEQRAQASEMRRNGYYYRRKYNLTADQYSQLLAATKGICPVGKRALSKLRIPHIDHCHETGVVRGMLCCDCNPS
jgi:hypothetical protein